MEMGAVTGGELCVMATTANAKKAKGVLTPPATSKLVAGS